MGKKDKSLYAVLERSLKIGPKQVKNKKGEMVPSANKVLTGSWESDGWYFGKGGEDGKSTLVVKIEDNFNKLVNQFNKTTFQSVLDVPQILRGELPNRLGAIRKNIEELSNKEVKNTEEERKKFILEIDSVQKIVDELEKDAAKAKEQAGLRKEQKISFEIPDVLPFTITLELLKAKTEPSQDKGGGKLQLFTQDDEPIAKQEIVKEGEVKFLIRASETTTHKEKTESFTVKPKKGSASITWKLPEEIAFDTLLTIKLLNAKATVGNGVLKVTEPSDGKFKSVGTSQIVKVELAADDTYSGWVVKGTTNVVKARQEIDWKPPDVTYPKKFDTPQRNATVKQGITSKLLDNAYSFPSLKVGKAKLKLVVPGDDNWLETTVEVEINVLPPTPPKILTTRKKECENANISFTMQGKIIDGQEKPGEKNKVRGGHSAKILKDKKKYNPQESVRNDDGTASVKFKMKLENGEWSDLKTSTVAPENWDDGAILAATIEVGKETPTYKREDGSTLHTKKVNGVQWDVIKDSSGNVRASYPTGGNITSEKAFKKAK